MPGAGGADGITGNVLGVALDVGATVELAGPTDGADLALEPPPK